jgi:transcriptional regulator with XRE-family HTH domain
MSTAPKLPIPDDSTFGRRIKLVRFDLGWSRARMARELDVPAATYRTWEEFDASPRLGRETLARKLRDKHGYDEEWLLHGPSFGPGGPDGSKFWLYLSAA